MKKLFPLLLLPFLFFFTACPGDDVMDDEELENIENDKKEESQEEVVPPTPMSHNDSLVINIENLLKGYTYKISSYCSSSTLTEFMDNYDSTLAYFSDEVCRIMRAPNYYIYSNSKYHIGTWSVWRSDYVALSISTEGRNKPNDVDIPLYLSDHFLTSSSEYFKDTLYISGTSVNFERYTDSYIFGRELCEKCVLTRVGKGNLTGYIGKNGVIGTDGNIGGGTGTGGNTGGNTGGDSTSDSFYCTNFTFNSAQTSATVNFDFNERVSTASVKYGRSSASSSVSSSISAKRVTARITGLTKGTTYKVKCTAKGTNGLSYTADYSFYTIP